MDQGFLLRELYTASNERAKQVASLARSQAFRVRRLQYKILRRRPGRFYNGIRVFTAVHVALRHQYVFC